MVYSIHDSTEVAIQRMVEASQRMIKLNNSRGEEEEEGKEPGEIIIRINPAIKRHFELEIETLQNAPRDTDKLEQLLKSKERQYQKATHIEGIERLVTEIEMLKVVLHLVSRREEK